MRAGSLPEAVSPSPWQLCGDKEGLDDGHVNYRHDAAADNGDVRYRSDAERVEERSARHIYSITEGHTKTNQQH